MGCLCILEIKPLADALFANTFCQLVGCLFILFMIIKDIANSCLVCDWNSEKKSDVKKLKTLLGCGAWSLAKILFYYLGNYSL